MTTRRPPSFGQVSNDKGGTKMNQRTLTEERSAARLGRFVPLAGVVFAVLTVAGYNTIGTVPDSGTPIANVTSFYSAHHGRVATGGTLLAWAAIFLAFFGAAIWGRIRQTALHPLVAAVALIGTAVAVADQLSGASSYVTLGDIGGKHTIIPAALQAWHISGSDGSVGGGEAILLLAVALAGILARALPRWLAWPALVIGILELTPIGFFASLAFLLWAAVAGIAMFLRPAGAVRATARDESTGPHPGSALTSS